MRVLVDTQAFIFGHSLHDQAAIRLLELLADRTKFELVLSQELQDQIRRVSKRFGGKDWAGELIDRIWRDFEIRFVEIRLNEYGSTRSNGVKSQN